MLKTFQSAKRFDQQYKTDQCVVIFDQLLGRFDSLQQ